MTDTIQALVLGDVHLPFHDANALNLAFKVASKIKPAYLVQIGDLTDGSSVSRHARDFGKSKVTLGVERQYAHAFTRKARSLCEQLIVTAGNHDVRIEAYLANHATALEDTHESVQEFLGLEDGEYFPYRRMVEIGKCKFVHDLGPAGVNAMRETLEAAGSNVVFGHTHQGGVLYDGNLVGERHVAMNVGWLGNPDHATYARPRARARWQHGVGLVTFDRNGHCHCHFVPFINNTAFVPGYGKVSL